MPAKTTKIRITHANMQYCNHRQEWQVSFSLATLMMVMRMMTMMITTLMITMMMMMMMMMMMTTTTTTTMMMMMIMMMMMMTRAEKYFGRIKKNDMHGIHYEMAGT